MRNVLERARDALRAGTRPIYQIDTGTWKVTHEELLAELERALKDLDGPAHAWIDFRGTVACGSCGVVKRGDGKNKPCRGGPPTIEIRAERDDGWFDVPPEVRRSMATIAGVMYAPGTTERCAAGALYGGLFASVAAGLSLEVVLETVRREWDAITDDVKKEHER